MSRVFGTALEMWLCTVDDLLSAPEVSSRNGAVKEILGWSGMVTAARRCWAGGPRGASLGYAFAELLWYFRGAQFVSPMLTAYAPSYTRFTNDGLAMGAYGHRWLHNPGVEEAAVYKELGGDHKLSL